MRFNAVIAATILAATVSGAAVVNPAPTEVAEATTETTIDGPSAEDLANFPEDLYYVEEGDETEGTVQKREAGDWVWSPKWRPVGLPVGKRDAEAEAGDWVWSPKWRPAGLPVGKRDAAAEADAGNWVWSPKWRPVGLPVGKRDAEQ